MFSCIYLRREKLVKKALGLMTQRRWGAALRILQKVLGGAAEGTELYARVNLAVGKCHLFAGKKGDLEDGHYELALHFFGVAAAAEDAREVRGEALAFAARCYHEMGKPVMAARKADEASREIAAIRASDEFNGTADEIAHLLEGII